MSTMKRIVLVVSMTLLSMLAISALGRVEAVELDGNEDFVPLATQGFLTTVNGGSDLVPHPDGSRRNNYIWSMLWWGGKLYAGTLRDFFCLGPALGSGRPPGYEEICPPPGTLTADQRAEIWQYTPGGEGGIQGTWQRVFQSPLVLDLPGLAQIPREVGYRNMVECDAGGTSNLYVVNLGVQARIIYTSDGSTFQDASSFGTDPFELGYRALICYKGRLWTSPAGAFSITSFDPLTFSANGDDAFRPALLVNANPTDPSSFWVPFVNVANSPFLGDPENVGIYALGIFGDDLYMGVVNHTTGFQIWKLDGRLCTSPPGLCLPLWQKSIVNGGGRPVPPGGIADNGRIFLFTAFNGYLYWTAGESGIFKFVLAEMGRIGPDGRWDLIVGEPRDPNAMAADPNFNCNLDAATGLCHPLSGMGVGFGPDPFTSGSANYIWQLEPHEGVLYAGTLQRADQIPGAVRGFDLWRSSNGIDWSIVSDDGFGNPFNSGVRKLVSTPLGLFVGTQNPNTIEDGSRGGTGGAEVWIGIGSNEE